MQPHVERLATTLLGQGEVLVDETSPPMVVRGLVGRAFCPTPRALAILTRAGAIPEPHPSVDVLRRVNSRAFSASLGASLPGAAFVTSEPEARATLATAPPVGHAWRVKHAFGMTGRNQRVVSPGTEDAADLAFVLAGLARGGVQIEPQVTIREELARHGFLHRDGSLDVGALVVQTCDARGAWLSTERVPVHSDAYVALATTLLDEVTHVGGALFRAGYFGPFGVDAFTYEDRDGGTRLQRRSEINARYSMGFPVGFGAPPAPRR